MVIPRENRAGPNWSPCWISASEERMPDQLDTGEPEGDVLYLPKKGTNKRLERIKKTHPQTILSAGHNITAVD